MSFKKGDKIRRINGPDYMSSPPMKLGEIYTFEHYVTTYKDVLTVQEIQGHTYESDNFELVSAGAIVGNIQKYKIGDRLSSGPNEYEITGYSNGYYELTELSNRWKSRYDEINLDTYFTRKIPIGLPRTGWTTYVPTSWDTNTTINISSDGLSRILDKNSKSLYSVKCECGSSKIYGENCGPEMHSGWCPRSKA